MEYQYGKGVAEIPDIHSFSSVPFRIYIFTVSPSQFSPSACFLRDLQGKNVDCQCTI